jgi:hypothetical protein
MYTTASKPICRRVKARGWSFRVFVFALLAALMAVAPSAFAAKGGNGGGGSPGPSATVTGKVTNNFGVNLEGAVVTFAALTTSYNTVTDVNGDYTIKVPANASYDVSFEAEYHETYELSGSAIKGKKNPPLNATLTATAPVILTAGVTGTAEPGAELEAEGSYIILDGSSFVTSFWSQGTEGVPPVQVEGDANPATVTLDQVDVYAASLIQVLKEPPITTDDLPPDLELQPINEIQKGLQDRNQVVAINPWALEKVEALPLIYTVETTSGTYTKEVDVMVHLPWAVSTGVRTVPIESTVLLYAKGNTAYNWIITASPTGSLAGLTGETTQTPWFAPDKVGKYTLQETNSGASVEVHAGRYHGVIDPLLTLDSVDSGDGRPVADENCTGCHTEGGAAPPNFDTWRLTGHAEAFTQGITTNGHFGENCFACHAVGFGKTSGIDTTPSYGDFMVALDDAQHGGDISTLWETMLIEMPDTARLSNIQCENCHGPQSYTEAHKDQPGAPRVNLGSETCGSCHGEPARHGRFQQWQLSNHADYSLAGRFGARSNCGRCHSGNGFIAWSKHNFNPEEDLSGEVTWNGDTVVPQVCAACHNPHDTGTTSGSDETNAKVRVNAGGIGGCDNPTCDTYELLAGFMADNVGKGATCMTCHNSRAEYPRNDTTWAQVVANGDTTDRPHHGVQADLIMGQNMYFVGTPVRGKHSLIEDTCVTCHMNKTQPPAILSYNQAGTNHTFAADPNICGECHGDSDPSADNIDTIVSGYMDDLAGELGAAYKRMMEEHYPIDVGGDCGPADGTTVTVTDVVWGGRATRYDVTLSNGNSCTRVDPEDVSVDGGATNLYEVSLAENDGATLKGAWNWSMMNEDNTINECDLEEDPECEVEPHTARGVHNPDLAIKGLTYAISAVQAVAAP